MSTFQRAALDALLERGLDGSLPPFGQDVITCVRWSYSGQKPEQQQGALEWIAGVEKLDEATTQRIRGQMDQIATWLRLI